MSIIDETLSAHVYEPINQYLKSNKNNYLEIGVFNGVGLAKIAKSNPDLHCEAVDPFIEDGYTMANSNTEVGGKMSAQYNSALEAIGELENVNLNVMTSHEYFDSLTEEKIISLNIGTVLIDGNHHYEFVVNDYKLAMAVIGSKAGLIVFDDINVSGVQQAFDEFCVEYADRIDKQKPMNDSVAISVFIKEKL